MEQFLCTNLCAVPTEELHEAVIKRTKQIKRGRRPSVFRNKEKTQGLT